MDHGRIYKIFRIFLFLFLILIARFFYYQICIGHTLLKSSVAQRTSSTGIESSRGDILDRNFIPFTNRSKKHIAVIKPIYLRGKEEDLYRICDILKLDAAEIKRQVEEKPDPIFFEVDANIKEQIVNVKTDGISIINSLKRYDSNSKARHILGYLNKVDLTGEAGVEKSYEEVLKSGKQDAISITNDARNNIVEGLGYRLIKLPANSRELNVKLTLDYHIQVIVEDVMEKYAIKGAVVVEDILSGDIVAIASKPDYDQNNVESYLYSSGNELFNRAAASYNLGSIFKIIDAALFFEQEYNPDEEYFCNGTIKVGGKEFKCYSYEKGGHGSICLSEAFALSCNPYFIQAGIRSGYRKLIEMARRFGIGEPTGIRDQGIAEFAGNLPDPYKNYSDGDIANISIGQGEIMATPIQVANIVATVANGGIKNRVNIVDSIVDGRGNKVRDLKVREGKRIISKEVADRIKRLMEEVISSGTGIKANIEQYGGAAGKTGSAETGRKGVVHAWFAGYFPRATPKYSMSVFIEGGMSGGDAAAPIFAEIAAQILKKGY